MSAKVCRFVLVVCGILICAVKATETVSPSSPSRAAGSSRHRVRDRERNERGETPLHVAAIRGDLEQVRRLLALGSDPNATDFAGWTPLHEACNHGWHGVALALLQAGAAVNARGLDDDTPLHDAAGNGHAKLARLLLQRGADVTQRNRRGKTPVDVASPSISLLLRSSSADVYSVTCSDSQAHLTFDPSSAGTPARLVAAATGSKTRGAPCEMRRTPPQNKGDKSSSPRVTLRLHQIKARDEKRSAKIAADVASYDNSRVQFSISMEGKTSCDDVYEFKSSKEATPVRGASASPDVEKQGDGPGNTNDSKEILNSPLRQEEQSAKRNFSDVNDGGEEGDEENRRKKRKDSEGGKENARNGGSTTGRFSGSRNGNSSNKCLKTVNDSKNGNNSGGKGPYGSGSGDRKSPNSTSGSAGNSPKLGSSIAAAIGNSGKGGASVGTESDGDNEELRGNKCNSSSSESSGSNTVWTGGPKVPPLKIVIPQQNTSMEQEQGNRNGKNGTARHHQALPYVVSSNSNDSTTEKDSTAPLGAGLSSSGGPSPTESSGNGNIGKNDDKKDSISSSLSAEEQRSNHHQRVLRSSHRSGGGTGGTMGNGASTATISTSSNPLSSSNTISSSAASSPSAPGSNSNPGTDRGSNNSSPQQSSSQRQSPSPPEPAIPVSTAETTCTVSTSKSVAPNTASLTPAIEEKIVEPVEASPQPQPTPAPQSQPAPVELHPRKRKMKQSKESAAAAAAASTSATEAADTSSTTTEVHPHEQPITNCYQLFLNIRKQIERRRKGLFPVQPKPPQGFKDYLMNRCTYVLAGNASSRLSVPVVSPPQSLQGQMKDLFAEQEKERYRLRMQHVIEKEKLVLSVEQEILRVHGRAARALANQSLPFSVCTILKDEEVYNVITPEQEEKDRNARSRYNGRLFLSWLQDVDDKWEKIKESMLLRHHNEAESLHAVQCMDWEWKMKELGICEFKAKPVIDELHVPMVHVSDDFDLLPA